MASNDPTKSQAASSPGSGRAERAPGPNDSSDTFTDMPSASADQERSDLNPQKRPGDDGKIDISSADDVDVDKDTPVDDEDRPDAPPDAVSGGG